MTPIWVIIGILIGTIVLLLFLYGFNIWPFNVVYHVVDPRTQKPIESVDEAREPTFNYSPCTANLPVQQIRNTYASAIEKVCGEQPDHPNCTPETWGPAGAILDPNNKCN